jgi:YVTN family beta-propeller protein
MKTALLKLALVAAFISFGAFSSSGLIPDDADGDGVPDSVDACPGQNSSNFDRNGDGCIDAFVGARHIEYWGVADVSIPYVINTQGAPNITNGTDLTAVQNAVSSWTSLPNTNLSVVYGGTTSQANSNGLDRINLVTFVDNAFPFSNLVLAVGLSTSFDTDTTIAGRVYRKGEIYDADMVFNPNKTYKVGGSGPGIDIQSVATHEAGHLFGLSHSAIQSSTMFYVLPGGLAARSLEADDRLTYFKAYGTPGALNGSNRIDGVVTDGQTDDPVPGAIVFLKQGSDTVGCEYTLPNGRFSFPGLANAQYTVWIHPLDGSSEIGFIEPANINALVQATAVDHFVPEGYDDDESATDDPAIASTITLSSGTPTRSIEIVTNIDAVPPVVTSSNPSNNTNDVAIDAAYVISFSEQIKLATITPNFSFREQSTNRLRGGNIGVIEDGRKIVFTPSPPLAFSENYTLKFDTGLTDEFGNALASPFTLHIATEAEPPVGLASLSPNKGVVGTTIVLTGNGFDIFPFPTVRFGNEVAAVSHATPTALVVTVPATAQTGSVTVTNGDAQVSNPVTFTVLTAAEIARGFESGQVNLSGLPSDIAVVPDGGYAYVATSTGVDAVVVNPALPNYLIATPIPYPGGVDAVSPTPSGRRVFGVSNASRQMLEINSDPTTGLLFNTVLSSLDLGAGPKGIVVEPSGYRAFVATDANEIQSWDIKLGSATYQQQVNALPTPGGTSLQGAMAVTPAGDRLLAVTDAGSLLFYSVAEESLLSTVPVGADPRDIVIEPTAERAYVTHADGRISVVNIGGAPFKVQDIQTGGSLRGAAVTPASRYIYASDRELDNLKIVDLDVASPTFRSVIEDIEAPTNPVDVALTPDGVYALSLLQGDGPQSADNPSRMLVTTIGAGPALHSIYPQAARVGSRVVLSGDVFGDPLDLDVATVDFNGVIATPIVYQATHITVVVPPGAASGPVRLRVDRSGGGSEIEVSNALAFQVLLPSPFQTNVRESATIENASVADFVDALAISPDGNTIYVGTGDGFVIAYDTRPGSPTFHQELDRFQYFTSSIEDIAIAADGKTGYATATGDTHVASFHAVPSDPNFGDLRQFTDLDLGFAFDHLKTGPDNRTMLVNAGVNGVRIIGTANHFNDAPMVPLGVIGSTGNVLDMAFHPSGLAAYIAVRNPDAILTVDMDETGMEFGLVQAVHELPGAPAPTPMSLAVYPDGSKLLAQCLQIQGPNTRTIFEFNINNATPYSMTLGNTFTPSGTADHAYQEGIRISPKADVGLRSLSGSGLMYFSIATPATPINFVGLLETLVTNEFEFTPDGNRAYMASAFHDSVRVFDFTPADNLTLASGNNQTGVAGQLLTAPLRIAVGGHINQGENFIPVVSPGIPVTFRVTSGGGVLRVGDTESDVVVVSSDLQGFAQILWRLGPSTGTQTVAATSSNLFGSPTVFTATASPDPDALPLSISEVLPINNTNNVSVTTAVLATFSRAVSPSSIAPGSFYLERVGGSPIPAAVGFTDNNRKVSLTPITSLPYSEQIRVVYTAAIQDAVGGTLTTPGNSAFQTQAPPPPRISAISPPSALIGVAVTISGAGFNPAFASNAVSFAGTPATPIAGGTDFLRVIVPATAPSGNVSVTVGPLTSNNVPFTVLVPNTSHIDDVIATIGTTSGAKSCAISPDGALCYNVSAQGDVVVPVDVEGQTTFPSIPVGDQPVAIVIDPSGTFAYVANFNSGTVSVIDVNPASATFNTVVSTITVGSNPTDLAIFPDGDRVLVANAGSSDVSVIDADDASATYRQVTATIGTTSGAKSCAVSGDGARIYIGGDLGFVVLEANSYAVTATIGTTSGAKSLAVSPDGTMLFVLETNGTLLIFDITPGSTSENQVVATIGTTTGTKSVAVSADGTLLYLIQEDSNQVIIIALDVIPGVGVINPDGATSFRVQTHVVGTLTTGDDPADVAIDPSGSGRVMVANAGDGTLSVYGPGFGPIEAYFRITPRTLNTKSNGNFVSGVIQVPPPHNVHEIDLSTVRVFDTVFALPGKEHFGDSNDDGIEDVTVRFCREDFIDALPENGEYVDVVVKGTVGADEFEGTDVLRVLRPNVSKPGNHERLVGGQPFTIAWESPEGFHYDKVNIEWTSHREDDDHHHECSGDDDDGDDDVAVDGILLDAGEDNVEIDNDEWLTIAHDVNNTGSFVWHVPAEYYPNAFMRITLVSRGKKQGESIVPFMIEMPVATRLKSFDVTMEDGSAVLRWETSFEAGMQGYDVVRSERETGRYDAVTKDMVRASGSTSGGSYEYRDESIGANRTYWYKLREVADNGLGAEYGPYSVTYRVTNQLDQNVPNPFNPTTVIKYAIASDNAVNLTIYDVAGRKVRTLVNERQRADAYRVTWDGSNDTGQKVASGVYFYKLVAGKFTQTKKMVLLK